MFNDADFQVFDNDTLAERMAGIRAEIDPKFEALAPLVIKTLGLQKPIYAHVAKHLRRHKNPPMNTWVAFSVNKRGYKMAPHIMIGFWDDRLFIWLASLAENRERPEMIQRLTGILPELAHLSADYEISPNHMAKVSSAVSATSLADQLTRYQQVKQADFLVGRQWLRGDALFTASDQQRTLLETVAELGPFFAQLI